MTKQISKKNSYVLFLIQCPTDRIELYNKIYFVCDIVFYMSGILPQKSAKSPTEFSDSGRDRSA